MHGAIDLARRLVSHLKALNYTGSVCKALQHYINCEIRDPPHDNCCARSWGEMSLPTHRATHQIVSDSRKRLIEGTYISAVPLIVKQYRLTTAFPF